MGIGGSDYYVGRRRRRGVVLPAFMSVGVLALAAVLFVLLRPTIGGTITDEYSGEPLADVAIAYGDQRATTDGAGRFTLTPRRSAATLVVAAPHGYRCPEHEVNPGDSNLQLSCRPTTLAGTLRRKHTDTPLEGITVRAVNGADETSSEAVSDANGWYELADVPADARLIVEGPGFARKEIEIGRATVLDLELRPDVISGTVRAQGGGAIPGATVAVAGAATTTGQDGTFALAGVPEAAPLAVRAPGYQSQRAEPGGEPRVDFVLEPLVVKAIYLTPDVMIKDDQFNALLALADRTEINAMVLDFKDESGWLHHDSKVTAAREIGAVHPAYDLPARLRTLQEHNIYTIARVVCFLDQTLPVERPHLAVRNTATGGIWENDNGAHWVSAMHPEAWDYNIAVAVEAASLGFDEVQYDYVRFPTDGDREVMDLGAPNTKDRRTDAIAGFLERTRAALTPYDTALAVDVFGVTLFDKNDNDALGQLLEKIAPHVDYICPMIYPSHYIPGIFGFDLPNDHPYEIILGSLELGIGRVPNAQAVLRPWLQDFSYGAGIDYGPNEVRAQIKATYDFGGTSWMLWNAANEFTEAALEPEGR